MSVLATAYNNLRECELATSQYDFSENWCGKGKSYYSWLKATSSEPSISTLTVLMYRLDKAIDRLQKTRSINFPEVTEHDLSLLLNSRKLVNEYLSTHC